MRGAGSAPANLITMLECCLPAACEDSTILDAVVCEIMAMPVAVKNSLLSEQSAKNLTLSSAWPWFGTKLIGRLLRAVLSGPFPAWPRATWRTSDPALPDCGGASLRRQMKELTVTNRVTVRVNSL